MQHGGKRKGAGRPAGSGKYQHATRVMRIPENKAEEILLYIGLTPNEADRFSLKSTNEQRFPLYSNSVSAGFPSPADDHIEQQLNLNEHLIKNPASTFFVRVSGESMKDVGIFPNDILIVDRSIKPVDGKIVIAVIDGELTVKRLKKEKNGILLMPENPDFKPIAVKELQDFSIWGVVTNVIHAL